jgi:hypothetical protein
MRRELLKRIPGLLDPGGKRLNRYLGTARGEADGFAVAGCCAGIGRFSPGLVAWLLGAEQGPDPPRGGLLRRSAALPQATRASAPAWIIWDVPDAPGRSSAPGPHWPGVLRRGAETVVT